MDLASRCEKWQLLWRDIRSEADRFGKCRSDKCDACEDCRAADGQSTRAGTPGSSERLRHDNPSSQFLNSCRTAGSYATPRLRASLWTCYLSAERHKNINHAAIYCALLRFILAGLPHVESCKRNKPILFRLNANKPLRLSTSCIGFYQGGFSRRRTRSAFPSAPSTEQVLPSALALSSSRRTRTGDWIRFADSQVGGLPFLLLSRTTTPYLPTNRA